MIILFVYFSAGIANDVILARSFFNKYNVLTVSGDDAFSLNRILLNGKILKQTNDDWTNVLPVPNSLQYVLLTSSYSKGRSVQCGDSVIPKRVEAVNLGENEWCITNDGKSFVSVASAQYYPYDMANTVYESCLKSGYYESADGGAGFNSCAERGLFLNEKQIASTKESFKINEISNINQLKHASTFNYYPSKRLGNSIVYTTTEGTYLYDIEIGSTKQLTDNESTKFEDVFLSDDNEIIIVKSSSEFHKEIASFLGEAIINGQRINNIYSANYADGHFYMLRLTDVRDDKNDISSKKIFKFELLRDGRKIENIELESISPYGYNVNAVQLFPLCKMDSIVCLYEDGHYSYKNRTLVPEYLGYESYTEEMVIDGEWRGDSIPNLIGRSKPIFEHGKLKYLVYTGSPFAGLYLIDFDKKWNFKELFNRQGPATTKLLGDYHNIMLNVVKR